MHFLVTGSSPVFELPVASFIAIPPGQRGRGEQDGTGQERFGEPVPAERVPQCAKRDPISSEVAQDVETTHKFCGRPVVS